MLASCRQQVQVLEDKFATSAQEIAKGNQIIQTLHATAKQAKAKLKIKSSELLQQEKATLEHERSEELTKHVVEEKNKELARAKEREMQLQKDVEDMKTKLAEAHDVLKSNQDVIEYLNRQLTERDLKGISPLTGPTGGGISQLLGVSTLAGGTHSAAAPHSL